MAEPETAEFAGGTELRVRNCSIDFQTEEGTFRAVSGVELDVAPGEKVMLLGPSGCGKSTLLKAVGGFVTLTEGEIRLGDAIIGKPGPDRVLVFQDVNQLFPWRTVHSNVAFAARTVLKVDKAAASDIADHYLDVTGLEQFGSFYPHALSGGMKQRAAIARAFAVDPKMLLMDEPFGALDAQTRQQLQLELNRLWQQTQVSLLFVTHSIDEAVRLGHRIVVMAKDPGRILEIINNRKLHDIYLDDIEAEPEGSSELRLHLRGLLHEARNETAEVQP